MEFNTDPIRLLADDVAELVISKYPGLDVEEVCAGLEMVKIRLYVGTED